MTAHATPSRRAGRRAPSSRAGTGEAHVLSLPLPGLDMPPATAAMTAGVDEAGRGCLAGPVVAAAVILPEGCRIAGLNDSKALSERQREALAPVIRRTALAWGLGMVWPRRIEAVNILQATFEAMARAVACLGRSRALPTLLLIDGDKTIPAPVLRAALREPEGLPRQTAIVGGDASQAAISAASILAKTQRDKLMIALDRRWPAYGFARHKGYGTAAHYAALRAHGPCPLHRLTFRGVLPDRADAHDDAGGTSAKPVLQGSLS